MNAFKLLMIGTAVLISITAQASQLDDNCKQQSIDIIENIGSVTLDNNPWPRATLSYHSEVTRKEILPISDSIVYEFLVTKTYNRGDSSPTIKKFNVKLFSVFGHNFCDQFESVTRVRE